MQHNATWNFSHVHTGKSLDSRYTELGEPGMGLMPSSGYAAM